jgi:NAD(P)H-flavin reductase
MRIADVAHDESRLRPFLRGIGRDHRKYGAVDWHYAAAGRALLPALRRVHGEAWSDRFEQAWAVGYDVLARVAVAAAAEDALVAPPWWDAEVVFHRRVRDDLAVIQVRPHTDYPFRPGQYCEVMSPARERMWRAYAFASAPRADGLLEFHVRAVGAGWVSSALVWRTRPGDVVRLGAPCGGDLAPADAERDLVCVTSGTGIAPVLAALQELERRPDGRRVHVFYAAAGHDDLYALPHLESIAIRYRPLAIVPVLPADGRDDHTAELLRSVVADNGDWRQHDVFVGGPVAITGLALEHLRTIGIPDDRLSHQGHGAP